MPSKGYFLVATFCAAVGCSVIVTSMLLPSWFTGCQSIRKALNESASMPESTSMTAVLNETSLSMETASSTTVTTSSITSSPIFTIKNASTLADYKLCVRQAMFIFYVDIGGRSTSLRLIVSKDSTLTIVASINLIISIICSAFAFFALVTAFNVGVAQKEEHDRAKKNCIAGMILLILAGILSIGGMCSYTIGSHDFPFEHFVIRLGKAFKTMFSIGKFSENSLTLSNEEEQFMTILLRDLSFNVKYSYAWYLGWIGATSLCVSAIFSVIAKRKFLTKPGQYTSLRTIQI